ncbi:MAG: bifunctional phosphoglucose/phosphomannose isomerase [Nanoarchaeota archaeon]|nr:MAG: bifunctional phosphoglucose/phosphomannose isomerase [Nanoarchaeota archaeon]
MAEGSKKMKALIDSFAEQVRVGYEIGKGIKLQKPSKIVFCGMGGSAIAGSLLVPFVDAVPIILHRYYGLPKLLDSKCWVILVSYSGNTEETIAAFNEALEKKHKMIAVTSGGELEKLAIENKVPIIKLPPDLPPRASLGYQFFALLRLCVENGLHIKPEIEEIAKVAEDKSMEEIARNLAKDCKGAVPLVYASEVNSAVAYRWKTQFNENSKVHAFFHTLPELNHNELLGYTKSFARTMTMFLYYPDDHERVRKRVMVTQDLIKPSKSTIVEIKGSSPLERFAYAIHLGDLVTFYLAEELKIDPFPVPVIERLKVELKK